MTTNIDFKLSGDTIIISEIKKDINYKSLNQTNIYNLADLKFSTEYVEKNIELVASFLNVIILKNNAPRYILIEFGRVEEEQLANNEDLLEISKRIIERNRKLYEELAK